MINKTPTAEGDAGFALLEVLVAISILAISTVVLFDIFSRSLGRLGAEENQRDLRIIAASVLASASAQTNLPMGNSSETTDGNYKWLVKVEPYGNETDRSAWSSLPEKITVIVTTKNAAPVDDTLSLATIRLRARVPLHD